MSLIVEYRESSPDIKLTDVARAVPELTLTIQRWHKSDDHLVNLFLLAEGDSESAGFDRLESALDDLEHVNSIEPIVTESAARLYHVTLVSKLDILPEDADVMGLVNDIRIEPEGLYITGYIADRAELVKTREFLEERGLDMQVERLYEAREERESAPLTAEQREALSVAYEMGYFAVPSRATQADVAAELGITTASLSERLKRGQERLIEHHLDERGAVD